VPLSIAICPSADVEPVVFDVIHCVISTCVIRDFCLHVLLEYAGFPASVRAGDFFVLFAMNYRLNDLYLTLLFEA